MIGISHDRERTALTKFLEAKNLKWLQVLDNLGTQESIARRYGVTSFPTKWLIDRQGHSRQLPRDADLDAEITQALEAKF